MPQNHTTETTSAAGAGPGRSRTRWILGVAAPLVVLLAGGAFLMLSSRPAPSPVAVAPPLPPSAPPPVVGTIGKRRTLQEVLAALGIAREWAVQIVQAVRPYIDFRRLKPQDGLE